MRVLILSPTILPTVTGNAVTVERWRQALSNRGFSVRVLATEGLSDAQLVQEVRDFRPDVVHAHHIFKAGGILLSPRVGSEFNGLPIVVSPAGTDISVDLKETDRREVISKVLGLASAIIVQRHEAMLTLKEADPDVDGRVAYVPKSFSWLGNDVFDLRRTAGCQPGSVLFFLPAGVRPVKGNLECLTALEKVYVARPSIRIVFAGPSLDHDYATQFGKEVARLKAFARWLPLIPTRAMRSAYDAADIVLISSFSEGLSNALLEAMAAGKPILASDIPGNREHVLGEDGEGPCGFLYDLNGPEDFVRKAVALVDDERLRRSLGGLGQKKSTQGPSPEDEAVQLALVYERAMDSSRGAIRK